MNNKTGPHKEAGDSSSASAESGKFDDGIGFRCHTDLIEQVGIYAKKRNLKCRSDYVRLAVELLVKADAAAERAEQALLREREAQELSRQKQQEERKRRRKAKRLAQPFILPVGSGKTAMTDLFQKLFGPRSADALGAADTASAADS